MRRSNQRKFADNPHESLIGGFQSMARQFDNLGGFTRRQTPKPRRHAKRFYLESLEARQLLAGDVTISELMAADQSVIADENGAFPDWIEVHNTSNSAVNLGGWYLTDDEGELTKWQFPSVIVEPDDHLVIYASGKDRAVSGSPLHASFRLDADGEYLALIGPDGGSVASEFAPAYPPQFDDFSFGANASGSGYFSVPTPGSPNIHETLDDPRRQIVINEIMYHPSSENPLEEYIELYNQSTVAVDLDGWQFSNGIDYSFSDTVIGAGQYLVVAADVSTFQEKYPSVSNVVGGWQGRLSNKSEEIELRNEFGSRIDRVTYADQGDWAIRARGPEDRGTRGWIWHAEHDGLGKSLELINSTTTNAVGQNWASSLVIEGTPGAANSVVDDNVAPFIGDVQHGPAIPRSSEPVTVTAEVVDDLDAVDSVALFWRVDGDARFQSIVMYDDGQVDDRRANDSTFTATIPAQPDGTIVEFYVQASDTALQPRTWPAATLPSGRQDANALYQVLDQLAPDGTWQPGSTVVYHQIMTFAERRTFDAINRRSDAQMNATFIAVTGTGVDVRYNAGIRIRGNDSRRLPVTNNRINLPADRPWRGTTQMNMNVIRPHEQIAGSVLYRLAGLPAAETIAAYMYTDGGNLRGNAPYAHVETLGSELVDNQFPNDPAGNLYKGRRPAEGPPDGQGAGLRYFGPQPPPGEPNPYSSYVKQTNESEADWSDVANLTFHLNNCSGGENFVQCGGNEYPDNYIESLEQVLDIDQWMRFLAMNALLDNNEGGLPIGDARGDDYAMYRGVQDTRFVLMPHDMDTFFNNVNRGIFRARGVPALDRMLSHPEILPRYYAQLIDLIENVLLTEAASTTLDEALGSYRSQNRIDEIKTFLHERSQHVLSLIPRELTIQSELEIVGDYYRATDPDLALSGTVPAAETRSVRVDGQLVRSYRGNGNWSYSSANALDPGINRILVEAFDGPNGSGNVVASRSIDIWYDLGIEQGPGVDLPDAASQLVLTTRDNYLPGSPILVRVEAFDSDGNVKRDLWDATATISVDDPNVTLSTDTVRLYNGIGSALVTIHGSGDFSMSAALGELDASRRLTPLANDAVTSVSGRLDSTSRMIEWSGIVRITDDVTVPRGHTLTILPGTLVLVDGLPVGATTGNRIIVDGRLQADGTALRPVTITSTDPDEPWGQIDVNRGDATFQYTNIHRAGNAPRIGHTGTGAAIRLRNGADFQFANGSITDIAGKIMQASVGDVTFRDALLARAVMGPEIEDTGLLFEDSWIVEMDGLYHYSGRVDDNDGIYLHDQQVGQDIVLEGGVIANVRDDGIDTLNADALITDFIVRNADDKAVSVFETRNTISPAVDRAPVFSSEVEIVRSLLVDSNIGVNTKGSGNSTPHTTIDRTTIAGVNFGIVAQDKDEPDPNVEIFYDVTNSIIWTNRGGDAVSTDYPEKVDNIHISYSNVRESWPGEGNINQDPQFVAAAQGNYHLGEGSPSIDAGSSDSPIDADGSRADQGFFGTVAAQSQTVENGVASRITEDTILTAADGPYIFSTDVVVAPETTLTIEPGTTLYFAQDAELRVLGTLHAMGTKYDRIRFTSIPNAPFVPDLPTDNSRGLPDGPPRWDGIHFVNSMSDSNTVAFADIEYAQDLNGSIGIIESRATIDNVTWKGTHLRMVYGENASAIIKNSTFPDMFGPDEDPAEINLDNISEHIKVVGRIPARGRFVIQNNTFGTNKGHNDIIDANSGSYPNPVVEILDNVFTGAGDELIDLGGDAYVAGNFFRNVFKDDSTSDRGYANAISTGDTGGTSTVVVARNVFWDVDHAINLKRGSSTVFENNTVVNIHDDFSDRFGNRNIGSAINLFVDEPAAVPGVGAYVAGNIFWDLPRVFGNVDQGGTESNLELHGNLIDPALEGITVSDRLTDHRTLGLGNLFDAPPLADGPNGDFTLVSGAPGAGIGPFGQDHGAFVPEGAWITGVPASPTSATTATLTVGGPGIYSFQYRVNGGPWSDEIPLPNALDNDVTTMRTSDIQLADLAPGEYFVEVRGKDFAGQWQAEPAVSEGWRVERAQGRVRINEVLAKNTSVAVGGSSGSDLIELVNPGTADLDLSGMSISDDPRDTQKYEFAPETILPAGQHLVLFADSQLSPSGIHLGFSLRRNGDGVYLFDTAENDRALLDSIEFGVQIPNLSIGRFGPDDQWTLTSPTFGSTNRAQATGTPSTLKINEWLANANDLLEDDFLEVYNPQPLPVALAGLYLTDELGGAPDQHRIEPLSFIDANGYVSFMADGNEEDGANHLNFQLSAAQEGLALLDDQLNVIDRAFYFPQTSNVSQGRSPNGGPNYEFFNLPTPGGANPDAQELTTSLIDIHAPWRYDDSGVDLGTQWRDPSFDDSQWQSGTGPLGSENEPLPFPIETNVTTGSRTFYFRSEFDLDSDPSDTMVRMTTQIDDGAIFYINGQEVLRLGMPSGNVSHDSFANRNINEAALEGPFDIPTSVLNQGANSIAVEVHQTSASSQDIVFGVALDASVIIDDPDTVNAMAIINGLRITEINYNPTGDLEEEFIEFQNTSGREIDLTGVRIRSAVDFTFPGVKIGPGEYFVVVQSVPAFIVRYGPDPILVGQYGGGIDDQRLNNGGEEIVVEDSLGRRIMEFTYNDQGGWPTRADGFGSSLELLDANSDPDRGASWQPSFLFGGTPGAPNSEPTNDIIINEVLTHTDPPSVDTVELFNSTDTDLDLSDPDENGIWYLSDSRGNYQKFAIPSDTVIPAGGYVRFDESQFNTSLGVDTNDFAFSSSHGDDVWLVQADAAGNPVRFVDHVEFPAAENGVSFARWPNGSQIEVFPAHRLTLGAENAGPLAGPVVISEIQYNPGDLDGNGPARPNMLEFVELYNRTPSTLDLTNWRIAGGIDMTFAPGTLIGPFQTLVAVSFDAGDREQMNLFRQLYSINNSISLVGPYTGRLDNGGETIRLERPDAPPIDEPDFVPYILVDRVAYDDIEPWPGEADGMGSSLTRTTPTAFGDFADSWTGETPTPGRVDFDVFQPLAGDSNGDREFNQLDIIIVLQGAKYRTGQPATFAEGDWNQDGVFDQRDIIAALQTGNYLQGPYAFEDGFFADLVDPNDRDNLAKDLVKIEPDNIDRLFADIDRLLG